MTIYTCGELKSHLLEQLTAHPDTTELDLSRVVELDTAGLQLLLMARRHVSESGRELRVINPSRAVSDVLELCRLGGWLAHGSCGLAS
jgi:anti-anti-sigma factor